VTRGEGAVGAVAVPHVRLDLWHVDGPAMAGAFLRMGTQRPALLRARRSPDGPMFVKLLGTAAPTTFTPRATDPRHWALLTTWRTAEHADAFDDLPVARSWLRICDDHGRIDLAPIASRGRWAGQEPFGAPAGGRCTGPVAALTRARVKVGGLRSFWQQSAEVARALSGADGLVLTTGIGEAPVGLTGTFSIWRDQDAMNRFARTDPDHRRAMERTPVMGWYAEELFARFRVERARGRFAGIELAHSVGSA
jgi:heme-degrading monooxygenase HmoA